MKNPQKASEISKRQMANPLTCYPQHSPHTASPKGKPQWGLCSHQIYYTSFSHVLFVGPGGKKAKLVVACTGIPITAVLSLAPSTQPWESKCASKKGQENLQYFSTGWWAFLEWTLVSNCCLLDHLQTRDRQQGMANRYDQTRVRIIKPTVFNKHYSLGEI